MKTCSSDGLGTEADKYMHKCNGQWFNDPILVLCATSIPLQKCLLCSQRSPTVKRRQPLFLNSRGSVPQPTAAPLSLSLPLRLPHPITLPPPTTHLVRTLTQYGSLRTILQIEILHVRLHPPHCPTPPRMRLYTHAMVKSRNYWQELLTEGERGVVVVGQCRQFCLWIGVCVCVKKILLFTYSLQQGLSIITCTELKNEYVYRKIIY